MTTFAEVLAGMTGDPAPASVEQRFATEFRQADSDEPGLVLGDDGAVYLVAANGSRTQVGNGGSQPFTLLGPFTVNYNDPNIETVGVVAFTLAANTLLLKAFAVQKSQFETSGFAGNPNFQLGLGPSSSPLSDFNWFLVNRYLATASAFNADGKEPVRYSSSGDTDSLDVSLDYSAILPVEAIVVAYADVGSGGAFTAGKYDIYALVHPPT